MSDVTQGARNSESYGPQRPGNYGKKIKTSYKSRVTREDVAKFTKKKKKK
jgi:hypothetical protein